MRRSTKLIIGVIATVAVLISVSIFIFLSWNNTATLGGEVSSISYSTFVAANSPPPGVTVVNSTGTIYVNQTGVTILIESTPPWANRTGDFFMCYGLINPTFQIRHGMTVTFALVNADDEYHNLVFSGEAPPYQYMPMAGNGMGMMWGYHQWTRGTVMLNGMYGNLSWGTKLPMVSLPISIQNTGTYWYFCSYPGHAQSGMYGRIIAV